MTDKPDTPAKLTPPPPKAPKPDWENKLAPPWAARVLVAHLQTKGLNLGVVWDPACSDMGLYKTLTSYGYQTSVSDRYAAQRHGMDAAYAIDFIDPNVPVGQNVVNSVVTMPPVAKSKYEVDGKKVTVNTMARYTTNALQTASQIVAMLVPLAAVSDKDMPDLRPNFIIIFEGKLNVHKDKRSKAASRTHYCWMVWVDPTTAQAAALPPFCEVIWAHAAQREAYEKEEDYPA